mmetsp:Transcript_3509/g.5995  ORF Transcript_3509/g.5995 Transcript_3509/m.5995 type:complete len:132 (+) Transcript_3509:16-411(+)
MEREDQSPQVSDQESRQDADNLEEEVKYQLQSFGHPRIASLAKRSLNEHLLAGSDLSLQGQDSLRGETSSLPEQKDIIEAMRGVSLHNLTQQDLVLANELLKKEIKAKEIRVEGPSESERQRGAGDGRELD